MEPTKSFQRIEKYIYVIRNTRVMLDSDLAGMYGVETRVLKQAVRRNKKRFPDDFMFVRVREMLGAHRKLAARLKELENSIQDHDEQIQTIFEAIRQLMTPERELKD